MKLKKITPFILFVTILVATFSCNKDSSISDTGNVALKAKATLNPLGLKNNLSKKNLSTIELTSFMVNIKKIEFEAEDNDTINEDLYSDLSLEGPFELNLSPGNNAIDITAAELPNNVYNKIQFKLDKSLDSQSDLFGKSIEIKGSIDGVPFVFWSDAEEEIKIDFSNANLDVVVNGNTTSTTINFDLSSVFGAASNLDFSMAVDGNQNGIIEIDPSGTDGNGELADLIKNLIEEGSEIEND